MNFDLNNTDSLLAAILVELNDNGPQSAQQLAEKACECDEDMDQDQMNDLLYVFAEEGMVSVDEDGLWSAV